MKRRLAGLVGRRHSPCATRPLSGAKRKSDLRAVRSAFDPRRTSVDLDQHERLNSFFWRPCPRQPFSNPRRPASRTTTMRCRFFALTFAIAMFPVVANAQITIDMGKITCGEYLAIPPCSPDDFSAWMSGWFRLSESQDLRGSFVAPKKYRQREGMVSTSSGGKCHVRLATIGRHKLTDSGRGRITMRCRALVVAVILIGAASTPATAQIKITCGDWLGYAPADREFVRFFLSGYYEVRRKQ